MDKKVIINEIAKKNNILLDENDPIFAVITANELIQEDFILKLDKLFIKHKVDLETYKTNILKELKEFANTTKDSLKELQLNEQPTIIENKKINSNIILLVIASQVIFLLIGIILGMFI